MAKAGCQKCSLIPVLQWKPANSNWDQRWVRGDEFHSNNSCQTIDAESPICIILASANETRACLACRNSLTRAFCIPEIWWSDYCRNSNGYLGSDITRQNGVVTGFSTWAYFEIKHLDAKMQYQWHKMNIFIRWLAPTKQTIILAFDTLSPVMERIPESLRNPDSNCLGDPFWVYARLASDVVDLQDSAVWAIRNQVRAIETQRMPIGKPQPDYRHIHDVARHAIHVTESLNVATECLEGILAQHDDFLSQKFPFQMIHADASEAVHRQLLFCKHMLSNLRHRSISNRERLQNEIQLAFNTVAQYDAGISVQIGRAAQLDGAAMRKVAFVTMMFLPATFISAVFSMSFFDFDADSGAWNISGKFWIYWVFAIPLTVATSLLWHFWHKLFPLTPMG
ncbi:uncharacterized protein F4812DRAFT_430290 [Daldinia caldariorum]|uniref:uncharacterized protein n=1 Tax=Daldinia caldariorum TaxID=326644 RepID=UPI0020072169|nr:uncharacterized protein F4812DRAFT_430290 [Daldinia caldariorum]KAI1467641.1 hypothetical protein F4812DRAFT_430290 [Daldinia caldariorum]